MFKVPVKIYFTRKNKNSKNKKKKKQEEKLGSKLGFICSLILVLFVTYNAIVVSINIQTGDYDYLKSDEIYNNYEEDINFYSDDKNDLDFNPMI